MATRATGVASAPAVFAAGAEKPALLGGPPGPRHALPFLARRRRARGEGALLDVLHSGKWYRGDGQTVSRFEEAYAR